MTQLTGIGVLDDEDLDVIEAALALGQCDHPHADLEPYRADVEAMTTAARQIGQRYRMPRRQADVLAQVIHEQYGYAGDRDDYENPLNANLLDVIDRRRGLPVALAILYVGLAERLGWTATGLNIPGHVLIRIGRPDNGVFQDPFDAGRLLDANEMAQRLAQTGGTLQRTRPLDIPTLAPRAMLVRLLNNLAARAEAAGDQGRALVIHERMTAVAPSYTGLWWERARLEQALGQMSAARASLTHMLETTRDRTLTRHIREALAGLSRSLN
jgi:regulator of sirC expression with transglutaminase-like and TPR domain